MVNEMSKHDFLDHLRTTRSRWDDLLSQLSEAQMMESGGAGDWSIKDIIAHVTWHEREMIGLLQQRALAGSELWGLELDQRNAAIFDENRARALPDVLAEAQATYPQLLDLLESLSDQDLNDAGRFRDMPGDWLPWHVLATNTYEHYQDHITAIQQWLNDQSGDALPARDG